MAVCPRAQATGMAPGLGLTEARALVPALRVAAFDAGGLARALDRCAEACETFTPRIALDLPEGIVLDITGCAHLFGGEAGLTRRVTGRFATAGLTLRLALADTPEAARAVCRFGSGGIVPTAQTEARARPLPLAALEADAAVQRALSRAGLRTLGDLADRPAAALTARFGPGLAMRLRRILGQEDARITPLRPPPLHLAERHFPDPFTALEPLLAVLDALAADLCRQLAGAGLGGRTFEATLLRADGQVRRLRVDTARPLRDPVALSRLLRLRAETLAEPIDPGYGYDALRLGALATEPLAALQGDLGGATGPGRSGQDLDALIDRLVTRFGRDRVLRLVARDSHDPDRAGSAVPQLSPAVSAPWPAIAPGEPPPRPLTLFRPPQPIEVLAEVPDGAPLRFRWRRVLHEVARAEGPERIAPEWWRLPPDAAPATRDYYRVEDAQGHRFWLMREGLYGDPGAPRWYLQGLFA